MATSETQEYVGGSGSVQGFGYDDCGNLATSIFEGGSGTGDDSVTATEFHHVDDGDAYLVDRPISSETRVGLVAGIGDVLACTEFAYAYKAYGAAYPRTKG